MEAIPPTLATDPEDVAWALQTAETLWKRNDRADAIVWLRRAAQAAGDAEQDDRALALARHAAELSDWMAQNPLTPGPPTGAPSGPSEPPAGEGGVDDLLRVSLADIPISVGELDDLQEEPTEMRDRLAPIAPSLDDSQEVPAELLQRPQPAAAPVGPLLRETSPLAQPQERVVPRREAETSEVGAPVAPTAQQAHAGMLDPWASAPPPPPAPLSDGDVVTSAPELAQAEATSTPRPPPPPAAAPLSRKPPPPLPKKPPVPNRPPARTAKRRPSLPPEPAPISVEPTSLQVHEEEKLYTSDPMAVLRAARTSQPPAAEVGLAHGAPALAPPTALAPEAPTAKSPLLSEPTYEKALHLSTGELRAASPTSVSQLPTTEVAALTDLPRAPLPEAPRAEALPVDAPFAGLSLADVEALADLPDDERAALERSARVQRLSKDEEVEGFALAFVVEGGVTVAATIADSPAERLAAGAVLKAKGTLAEESVPLKLVAPEDGVVVATWTQEQIEHAFRSCPWVDEELRAQANRVQALVGLSLGPIAERLDADLRMQVTSRLDVRELAAGEVLVEAGQPVRTMVVVGQGKLELLEGDAVRAELGPGDILFPTEILGAGAAPRTARAAEGGALVLHADRAVAQELMVTCPPLLEIFAGM
jgi:hypothetical protein